MKLCMIDNCRKGTRVITLAILMIMMISVMACPDSANLEDESKKAQKEVVRSLILPPDGVQRKTEVKYEHDGLYFNYGTNDDVKEVAEYYKRCSE